MNDKIKKPPPGKVKIMKALSKLLEQKDFHSITTAVIAKEAGVTEGLIYKYFKDKKDLLYEILGENFARFYNHVTKKITPEQTSIQKLEIIIKTTIKAYAVNRVFARIILLEVRNSPNYFDCPAYEMVKLYSSTILDIIRQGQKHAEIKKELDPYALRKVIIGSIEHACLGEILFNKELDHDLVADQINDIIVAGVQS